MVRARWLVRWRASLEAGAISGQVRLCKFCSRRSTRGNLPIGVTIPELFNKMPDIGSSQNVQTVQEPEVNGNATQNGDKSPNDEVCVIFLVSHDNYAGL